MRKTIVHLIAGLGYGGAERQLQYLVTRSDAASFRHVIISMTDEGPLGAELASQGIEIHALNMARGRVSFGGFFQLRDLLKTLDAPVLQTWMYHAGLLGLIVGRMAGVQSIIWNLRCSNMALSDYGRLTGWVVKVGAWLSPKADVVVVNSKSGQLYHEQIGYHPKNWKLIYNGFDADLFVPSDDAKRIVLEELDLDENVNLIGLIARFDPMKGHDVFVKAALHVLKTHKNVHFILVGKGVDQANDDRLGEHLHVLGAREDIPKITAALDIAVSSSLYGEGFPNTVGEAMACGVPCVVTNVGDSADIVGEFGWVVPPRDANALAEAMVQALDLDAKGRQELGKQVRERMISLYSLDEMTTQYHDLYKQCSQ